jgi:hypothetical protein
MYLSKKNCKIKILFTITITNKIMCIEECFICFHDIDTKIKMNCNHYLHLNCGVKWLQKNNKCPLCNKDSPLHEYLLFELCDDNNKNLIKLINNGYDVNNIITHNDETKKIIKKHKNNRVILLIIICMLLAYFLLNLYFYYFVLQLKIKCKIF